MKKIAVILLILTLTLAMAACGGEEPKTALAYDIYSQATEAMSNIESLAANTSATIFMLVEDDDVEMVMSGLIKVVCISETEVEMQMDMSTKVIGETMDFSSFYKGGIYYVEMSGQKLAMELPLDQIQEQATTEALSFPDTAIKNQQATAKDGGHELTFLLDGSALTDSAIAQLGSLSEMLAGQPEITVGDIEYVVFIDGQGNLKTTLMSFSMELSVRGETVPMNAEISLEYVQFNDVSIDFPDDLDSYQLFSL